MHSPQCRQRQLQSCLLRHRADEAVGVDLHHRTQIAEQRPLVLDDLHQGLGVVLHDLRDGAVPLQHRGETLREHQHELPMADALGEALGLPMGPQRRSCEPLGPTHLHELFLRTLAGQGTDRRRHKGHRTGVLHLAGDDVESSIEIGVGIEDEVPGAHRLRHDGVTTANVPEEQVVDAVAHHEHRLRHQPWRVDLVPEICAQLRGEERQHRDVLVRQPRVGKDPFHDLLLDLEGQGRLDAVLPQVLPQRPQLFILIAGHQLEIDKHRRHGRDQGAAKQHTEDDVYD
mmetsp:Transcript_97360/g.274383  ORF Transcript_97360/g.274383 Transcript_97360/m.274383 type:complete len:286 (-) Transcript_97360:297-1154(-)